MSYGIYISTSHATFLLIINDDGVIIDAPPIARWSIGKQVYPVAAWYRDHRGAHVESVP